MRCANASLVLLVCGGLYVLASPPPAQVGQPGWQLGQTENILREQVRSSPASFQPHHALGEFYIQQHNFTAAIPCLEAALQIDTCNEDNADDLALTYLQTGASAKRREVMSALLERKDHAELHNLLGDVEEARS